ncbi:hypothetical protein ACOMHN_017390 [Nucella lapillus]
MTSPASVADWTWLRKTDGGNGGSAAETAQTADDRLTTVTAADRLCDPAPMKWKQSKMAAKGESSNDSAPSTYSPLTRKPSGPHSASYRSPQADATSYTFNNHSQYDAVPIGTLGTYDPAAEEIDYSFYQNVRPNRRRLLYCRPPEPDTEEERSADIPAVSANGRRKNRAKREVGTRNGSGGGGVGVGGGGGGGEISDMSEDGLMEEAELSTETLYVMLLVLASTAVTMLAAYLILL